MVAVLAQGQGVKLTGSILAVVINQPLIARVCNAASRSSVVPPDS